MRILLALAVLYGIGYALCLHYGLILTSHLLSLLTMLMGSLWTNHRLTYYRASQSTNLSARDVPRR